LHSHISHHQFALWLSVLSGQILVGAIAILRRNRALALYLAVAAANSLALLFVARTGSAMAYYHSFIVGTAVDYAAMAILVALIYRGIRQTGIPSKHHSILLQILAGCLFAAAIFAAPFPLETIAHPQWRMVLAVDRVVFNWLSLLLVIAPFYLWMVDAAKDVRILLIYLGLVVYVAVHLQALDLAIANHFHFANLGNFAYFLSLVLWCCSSFFQPATHQFDPTQMELVKEALRRKRRSIHEQSTIRKVFRQ
jgi:hypothetical protein